MARRYRVTATATVVFLSDTLEWMGQRASPDVALGQFRDTVRLINKEGVDEWTDIRVYPDWQTVAVVVDDDDAPAEVR